MEIRLKYIFNVEFIITFFMLIVAVIFLIWVIIKIKEIVKKFKSFANYVFIAFMFMFIYEIFKFVRQEITQYSRFDANTLMDVVVWFSMVDVGLWIIFKFMQAYAKRNMYKNSDIDSPKKLKKNIEFLVNEQNFKQNAEMEKLYNTLQVSALSIKKQKKILRSSFLKNISISIIFFVLGLIIPELIMLIISKG